MKSIPKVKAVHVGFRTVWVPPPGYFQSAKFQQAKAGVPARKQGIEALRRQVR